MWMLGILLLVFLFILLILGDRFVGRVLPSMTYDIKCGTLNPLEVVLYTTNMQPKN